MWITDNDNTFDVQNDLAFILPENLRDKSFELTSVYMTTFSLDTRYLIRVLYSLDAIHLIKDNKVHVFYDAFSRSKGQGIVQEISEKYLHGIRQEKGAYHPKVILLRYKNQTDKNDIRYTLLVMSKNLTDSMLIDAFACVCGKVGAFSEEVKVNGEKVSEFFKSVFNECQSSDVQTVLNELRETDFRQENGGGVNFLNAKEVSGKIEEIKEKSKIIVVSPFLSDEIVGNISNNLEMLVSTYNGFSGLSKLKKDFVEKTRIFPLDTPLHAKIYSWWDDEDKQAHWIVGSSNATNNGLGINQQSGNTEFNIEFCTDESEYKRFLDLFQNSEKATHEKYEDNTETFEAAKHLKSFLNKVIIECRFDKDEKNINVRFEPRLLMRKYHLPSIR
ncbi:MAG: NgoFVII family restriction endonuclease [Lachnospiraceae bacterium]|nr:NgoFVII family restriction endonuclease [Lachnospiraceae bacterium]